MRSRDYLELAREWVTGTLERHWRGAVGRAYYAVFLECRDSLRRWGFHPSPRENIHTYVRLRFTFAANADLKQLGNVFSIPWANIGTRPIMTFPPWQYLPRRISPIK